MHPGRIRRLGELPGKLLTAAKHLFDARNLTSLKAMWEDRKWIGSV